MPYMAKWSAFYCLLSTLLGWSAMRPAGPLEAASPRIILLWNETFVASMRRDTLPPPVLARNLAILHLALHWAHVQTPSCEDALASLVAFKVCSALMPAHGTSFEKILNEAYPQAVPDADRRFAQEITTPVLDLFARDRSTLHLTYLAKTHPGIWNRTAPFFRDPELPHWGRVRPILLKDASQFRPHGPPPLRSQQYAQALKEVRVFGGKDSIERSQEQTLIARFWSDFSYTETPVGHWNSITRVLLKSTAHTGPEVARLLCQLNVALCDCAIACWDTKFHYEFWRPITAIHRADEDDNPFTEPVPAWTPLLHTPNHPEYVSGHSTFSGAALEILTGFFQTENIPFEISNDTMPDVTRKFKTLRDCAAECGESRIWGGIHYRFSCDDGLELGIQVAKWTRERFSLLQK